VPITARHAVADETGGMVAKQTRFAPDRGLTSRMLVVMFILGLLYVAFIGVLIVVLSMFMALGAVIAITLIIAGGFFFIQYFASDKIAMFAMRAHEVTPQQAPELHAIVDRLCALADMPKPRVAIADSNVPNAFATGRNQKNAVICATTGILDRLDNEQLEGVLSHELSHVAHKDVAVMTIASFLGVLAGLATRILAEIGLFGGFDRRDDNDESGMAALVVLLVSAVVYAISFVLIRTLSRYRELAADRSGALLTGNPSALASALVQVSGDMSRIPTRDLRAAEPFNAFFFAPALSSRGASLSTMFSTHPSLEVRLEKLGQLAAQINH
jgi:heat shock protein HtpX